MERESLKEVLSHQYHCQYCGGAHGWDAIRAHEQSECPKRPSKGGSLDQYIPLPEFDIDASSQAVLYQPGERSILVPLPEEEFDHLMQQMQEESKALDEEEEQDHLVPDSFQPPKPVPTNNIRSIFQRYKTRTEEEGFVPEYRRAATAGANPDRVQGFAKGSPTSYDGVQRVGHSERHNKRASKAECIYCHRPFPEGQLAHRIMHQRICAKSPAATLCCVFCEKQFTSTLNLLALEQVAAHEEVCGYNPRNMCRFCGQTFSAPIDTAPEVLRRKKEAHLEVCKMSPHNKASCRFCTRQFETNAYGSALNQCTLHMRNCAQNPRNSCRFCGLQFRAPLDSPPGLTAVDKRRQHEASCPQRVPRGYRRREYDYEEERYYPAPRSAPVTSVASHDSPERRARKHIIEIDRSVDGMTKGQLRSQLRQLQLKWHPDKNTRTEADERIAIIVFQHVQSLWNEAFNRH
eukprot:Blabericola_migrator_1__231@NODE_1060_length_5561_cov_32_202767_g104_i4_p2_GENE_NODE_1060_length_5561_cov_32_202767_g104_i4NODE_1060_length_5561_cov_32_202767_g104_i4_p2_ORF_typecomplete_len461_score57_02DnaJ/PF00226_31/0_00011HJURP_C/PF12347_8/1_4HJURP_C/PF12347_8/2_9e03zfC2H2_3rep/PF18868_1/6_5e02zfC2H2_3rep/PF18868_1/1_9e02zfC2H2_3rep/PF18868_1/4_8e02zfC2H2_3rep/PF18868_1/2_5PyrI_C/PF02748_15/19PyrI_C/PF02748_15/19PyrI_C/PF02748_15/33PyrI_C/PF02748_15/9_2e02PyrI_C/PF02748_15/2_4e02PyrI_C/PF02